MPSEQDSTTPQTSGDAERAPVERSAPSPHAYPNWSPSLLFGAIVFPESTDQVSYILESATAERIPVVPRGAGTSLIGGADAPADGVVIDMIRMNRILRLDAATMTATVEAGVINGDLQRAANAVGLFYPPDPASLDRCTLGGNVACDAGGPHCLKYGVTKDYVLGMTVVLADGRVLRLGGPLLKNATGYQLAQLFVGSEGTLGVITEITLKLLPLPRARATASAIFADLDAACAALTAVLASGLLPAAMELLDGVTLRALDAWRPTGFPAEAGALLLIEQDGSEHDTVAREIASVAAICRSHAALDVHLATDEAERERLWSTRRSASEALGRRSPQKLGEDIVVPRDQIPAMVRRIGEIGSEYGVEIAVFGHAGDGNLHPNILVDPARPGERERVQAAADAILRASLALGGQLSGEHGIGLTKGHLLREAIGDDALNLMLGVKRLFDPLGILNPGKLFTPRAGATERGAFSDGVVTG